MLKIGLTGGIGSGKTAVSRFFSALKVPVIDADKISHELVAPGQASYAAIVGKFGVNCLRKSGKIDRPTLRKEIFAHPEKRLWLESLLHPLIRAEMFSRMSHLSSPYCIIVIPLLTETQDKNLIKDLIDRVLVVDVPERLQTKRVMVRDHLKAAEARAILKVQSQRAKRLQWADDVMRNEGSLENLRKQVLALHQKYLSLSGVR
ncbi:MAG: dephospho-CoA kinase [Gammaproteobacteria bacterium]|nr:dephospho-CoA kinase [Gammaproteobacteria bacterium]